MGLSYRAVRADLLVPFCDLKRTVGNRGVVLLLHGFLGPGSVEFLDQEGGCLMSDALAYVGWAIVFWFAVAVIIAGGIGALLMWLII